MDPLRPQRLTITTAHAGILCLRTIRTVPKTISVFDPYRNIVLQGQLSVRETGENQKIVGP
ncbi:hypothetical protein PGB90_009572 [Kerria lacca]